MSRLSKEERKRLKQNAKSILNPEFVPTVDESKMRDMIANALDRFWDHAARAELDNWTPLFSLSLNNTHWDLYAVSEDVRIAYSMEDSWADAPWAVVSGFASGDPDADFYCPNFEDAVRTAIHGGDVEPAPTTA